MLMINHFIFYEVNLENIPKLYYSIPHKSTGIDETKLKEKRNMEQIV